MTYLDKYKSTNYRRLKAYVDAARIMTICKTMVDLINRLNKPVRETERTLTKYGGIYIESWFERRGDGRWISRERRVDNP